MMLVLGRERLLAFSKKHGAAKAALDTGYQLAKNGSWQTPRDITNQFGTADFLPGKRVIFNIKGNHYRLVVRVRYRNGIVAVDWVGTHAEYDKKRF